MRQSGENAEQWYRKVARKARARGCPFYPSACLAASRAAVSLAAGSPGCHWERPLFDFGSEAQVENLTLRTGGGVFVAHAPAPHLRYVNLEATLCYPTVPDCAVSRTHAFTAPRLGPCSVWERPLFHFSPEVEVENLAFRSRSRLGTLQRGRSGANCGVNTPVCRGALHSRGCLRAELRCAGAEGKGPAASRQPGLCGANRRRPPTARRTRRPRCTP